LTDDIGHKGHKEGTKDTMHLCVLVVRCVFCDPMVAKRGNHN